jgi:hypothetical protein
MPYKDPQAKREWERQHRAERLARRRELRRDEAAQSEVQGEGIGAVNFLLPVIAGGALAAYSPKLAIGTGGLTLAVSAIFKKGASWWVMGILIVLLGLFFYWSDRNDEKTSKDSEPGPKPILL